MVRSCIWDLSLQPFWHKFRFFKKECVITMVWAIFASPYVMPHNQTSHEIPKHDLTTPNNNTNLSQVTDSGITAGDIVE